MDLLGSILNSMDKPPTVSDKQKELLKRQKQELLKKQNAEKEMLKKFRLKTEKDLNSFLNDPKKTRLRYPPMEQIFRSIVHEVAEESGLTAHSFGKDGIDRYIMIFKKEYPPSEDELAVLRNGEEWSKEKEQEIALRRELEREEQIEASKRKNEKFTPNSNYQEKYQHLIGLEAAKDAARATKTNKQYGFVPSENKKDHRSIEETLADIQKKKRKLAHNQD
ncbi:sperm-associated antigen 7 homolog [Halyomorpha halys]|uniref:sperm-associated antigen 7 homolog n=1 Tax=Halyomorpha halys TaxID=286706 RepID=UPI0006D5284F|nr:sperm-associated antigen 7 homolog [Halyomorpha halys]